MSASCQVFRDRMWSMLDAMEEPLAESTLIEHLRACPACRTAFSEAVRAERLLFTAAVVGEAAANNSPTVERTRSSSTSIKRHVTSAVIRRTTKRIRRRPALSFMPWLASAAALVLLIVGITLTAGPRAATIPWAVVEEASALTGSDGRMLMRDQPLAAGVKLVASGPATVRLRDGTRVWLEAGTRLGLDEGGSLRGGGQAGISVHVESGAVGVTAKPQDLHAPLVVSTPLAEVIVVGTAFRVSHNSSSGSELSVSSGSVKLVDADGERMVQAGGHARVDSARPPAKLLARFSASSLVNTVEIDDPIRGWGGTNGLLAVPPIGLEQPLLRQLDDGYGLCFNGDKRRLDAALPSVDARHGLTLIALFIPINPGREQRVISVMDGNREQLALVRHDLRPGAAAVVIDGQERLLQDITTERHWSVAARWMPDGAVVLNTGVGSGRRASAARPPTFAQPHLLFGGSPGGNALEGDLIAVELYAGVLDDAALAARMRALASANHFRLTTW
jgi:FecR protein